MAADDDFPYLDYLMIQYRLAHEGAVELVAKSILCRGRLLALCQGVSGEEWTLAMESLRAELHGAVEAAHEAAVAERTRRLERAYARTAAERVLTS